MSKTQKPKKMYFVRIRGNLFLGWNSVYASNIKEAKSLLKQRVGDEVFNKIAWETLLKGKKAETENAKVEASYAGMFD